MIPQKGKRGTGNRKKDNKLKEAASKDSVMHKFGLSKINSFVIQLHDGYKNQNLLYCHPTQYNEMTYV